MNGATSVRSRPGVLAAMRARSRNFGSVMLRRFIGLCLVTALLALVPAAHASPPDQSWIPGLYDNADFDDVILLLTSGHGAIEPDREWSLRSSAPIVGFVTSMDTERWPLCPLSSPLGRAPPLA